MVKVNTINGQKFRQMIICGANQLEEHKKLVDEMNVFPVPDGDTGTNMSLTVTSAVKEMLQTDSESVSDIAKALSSGALRGARGNSGVILSQLFRGFYKGIKGHDTLDSVTFAQGVQKGVEVAYKAVMKPKEGTILTVARGAAEAASDMALATEDIQAVVDKLTEEAQETLKKTPDMLPVLKEAGVVDSGGQGLVYIYTGLSEAMKRTDDKLDEVMAFTGRKEKKAEQENLYCVEAVIKVANGTVNTETDLEEDLQRIGKAVIVLRENDEVKIHVHTEKPGDVLTECLGLGALTTTKVENIAIHHEHILGLQEKAQQAAAMAKEQPPKEIGFIAVSAGEGLKTIFTQLGVDYVISGGQTMNPSTEDILSAAKQVNAQDIFVLPNNKNIILAAQQAVYLLKDKTLHVIPTKSIPQGIAAMISYMPGESAEVNEANMNEGVQSVTSGSVTHAVRDTHIGEFDIKVNDILALKNGEISHVGKDLMQTTKDLLDDMVSEDTSIVTIYYGEDSGAEACDALKEYIQQDHPDVEVEIQDGGQPVYYFLLSAE